MRKIKTGRRSIRPYERKVHKMKKYYLTNYETLEIAYFDSDNEALKEAQRRNRFDRAANWKAYTEQGDAIYSFVICR